MGVNADYFSATVQYLNILTGEELVPTTINGKDAYSFHCPFCTCLVHSIDAKHRRTARLIRERADSWVFTCSRGFSVDCKGGVRSMHNFLLLLNPDLYREYMFSLSMTNSRNHKALRQFKNI